MGELATKIRAKFPGAYDDISDSDLETKITAKFPGVYDDLVSKSVVQGNPDASAAETERMKRDFIRKEGALKTRIKERAKTIATPAEIPRFAAEAAAMTANAGLRGLKGVASTVQAGGEAIRQGSIDAGLQKFAEKQAEFQPMESPLKPSGTGSMLSDLATKGINYANEKTGRPDIVEPVAQGLMDIGALVGLKTAIKPAIKGLKDLATPKPAESVKLSPNAAKQVELADLSQQHNVPLTVGELRGSTGLKAAETQLERVPAVGIRGFREKQSNALKTAAESLVDNLTTGVDDSGIAIQQGLLNKMNAGKKLAKQAYDRIDEAMTKKGVINEIAPVATREAAKTLLAEYPDIFDRLPSGTVKNKLQIIVEDTASKQKTFEGLPAENPIIGRHGRPTPSSILDAQGMPITETVQPKMSFKDARSLREQLGNYIDRAYKSAGAVGGKELRQLSILKSALDGDINTWAENSPHVEINNAFRNANKVYRDNVAPFKEFIVKKATGDTFDTDLMAKTFIKNDRPQLAGKLMNLLDDQGKAAVKHSILKEALDLGLDTKTDVPFSPAKFATKLERYGKTLSSIFTPEELTQINGFVKLARAAERAGQYAENPPTGLRAGDLGIYTGFGYGLATNPLATFGTVAALKFLSSLLTSDLGRKLLTRSAKVKEGTPAWNSFMNYANEKMEKGGQGEPIDSATPPASMPAQRPGQMERSPGAGQTPGQQPVSEVQTPVITPEDSAKINETVNKIDRQGVDKKSGQRGSSPELASLLEGIRNTKGFEAVQGYVHQIAAQVYQSGMKVAEFAKAMKEATGAQFDKVVRHIATAYEFAKKMGKDERGLVGKDIKYPKTHASNWDAIVENRPFLKETALKIAKEDGAQITPDGNIVMYHGTRSGNKIRKSGVINQNSYLTTDRTIAERYAQSAQQKGKTEAMAVVIDPQSLMASGNKYYSTNEPVYYNNGVYQVEPPQK